MDGSTREEREAADRLRSSSLSGAPPLDDSLEHSRRVLRRFVGAVLAVYWLTLFVATHLPLTDAPVGFRGADKVVHFVGYGVLGLLAALWIALRRPLTTRVALAIVALLATYGALDELLQIPVGRSCDLFDWVCDVIGAAFGVLLMGLVTRLLPRSGASRVLR